MACLGNIYIYINAIHNGDNDDGDDDDDDDDDNNNNNNVIWFYGIRCLKR
jgi:hypothetical protein